MNLNGKIIAIEGTDGSGKATQAQMLRERLIADGYSVYSTSFPNYESDSSAPVKMYLNGEIKPDANDVSAKAASIFYATDRYITYKREIEKVYKEANSVIIFDRWVNSNIIHQGSKLISSESISNMEKEKILSSFINWIDNLEHGDFEIPRADINIYLNVPIEYTIKLRENRLNKITGKEKQDIHESDINYLINASKTGLIAAKQLGWVIIECVKDGNMRSIEDIADEIYNIISKF